MKHYTLKRKTLDASFNNDRNLYIYKYAMVQSEQLVFN